MDWADLQLRDDLGRSVLLADHRKAHREWRDAVVLGSHRRAVGTAVEVQSRRVGEARSDDEARPDDEHHGGSRAGDANSGGTLTKGNLPRLEATATNRPPGSNGAELLERGVSASKRSDLWLVIQPLEKSAVEQGATYFYVGFGSANVMASSPSIPPNPVRACERLRKT